MAYDPSRHHRLKGYDYRQCGAYFITICTQHRKHLFGKIVDGVMLYNELGHIAHNYWQNIPAFRPFITLDAFIIMPNHMHGILIINDSNADLTQNAVRATESRQPQDQPAQKRILSEPSSGNTNLPQPSK
uniref:Transposase IS200-like domain-containing protein n=1 Tax=Roseihalotalea indica TaxID=2867963 RepID=A0AA49JC07_9BACT|nr:hypothetical protein K4G66_17680 [Tunicatimonas sp. TK19036]